MKNDGIWNLLRDRLAAYRRRHESYRVLTRMDPRALRDIGLAPDDVVAVLNGSIASDSTRRRRDDNRTALPKSRPTEPATSHWRTAA